MYNCETESLRQGNVLVKVFGEDKQLVGVGWYFGRGTGKIYPYIEISSSEDEKVLTKDIAKACYQQQKLTVPWKLQEEPQEQPNASEG